jgi:hypothetical protein
MGNWISSDVYAENDLESIRSQLKDRSLQQKRIDLTSSGILQLQGQGGCFNPSPPLVESWMKGKITGYELSKYIDQLNEATVQAHIGLKKQFHPSEIPLRYSKFTEALKAEVNTINSTTERKGVKFVLDEGLVDVKIVEVSGGGDDTLRSRSTQTKNYTVHIVIE